MSIDDYELDAWDECPDNDFCFDDDEMTDWAHGLYEDAHACASDRLYERSNAARETDESGESVPWVAVVLTYTSAAEWLSLENSLDLGKRLHCSPCPREFEMVRHHLDYFTHKALSLPPDSPERTMLRRAVRGFDAEYARWIERVRACASDASAPLSVYGIEPTEYGDHCVEGADPRSATRVLRVLACGARRARTRAAIVEVVKRHRTRRVRSRVALVKLVGCNVTRRPRALCERIRPRPVLSERHASQAPPVAV